MAIEAVVLPGTGEPIAADSTPQGYAQLVKLGVATDASSTPIPADASGLYVQLGAALPSGTAAIGKLAANAGVTIGNVGVISLPALTTSTAEIGRVELSDGTTQAEITSTGTNKALYTALVDGDGERINLPPGDVVAVSPALDTSAYAVGDTFFTPTECADVIGSAGGTGHLFRITIVDKQNFGPAWDLYVCSAAVSGLTANGAYSGDVSDSDATKIIEKYSIVSEDWEDHGGFKRLTIGVGEGMPLAYHCAATSLYIYGVIQEIETYSGNNLSIELQYQPDC